MSALSYSVRMAIRIALSPIGEIVVFRHGNPVRIDSVYHIDWFVSGQPSCPVGHVVGWAGEVPNVSHVSVAIVLIGVGSVGSEDLHALRIRRRLIIWNYLIMALSQGIFGFWKQRMENRSSVA